MSEGNNAEKRRTSVWIDLRALEENYYALKGLLRPPAKLLCVIKADAYGHGAVEAGRRLESLGVSYFGVASVEEGKELREQGIRADILVLAGLMPWDRCDTFVEYNLTPTVGTFEALEKVASFTGKKRLKIHLKLDTGMGRLGFVAEELPELTKRLKSLRAVEIEGVMSHFPCSEKRDDRGLQQVARFAENLDALRKAGVAPRFAHMANSGAICNYPEAHFDLARPGVMLYGAYPDQALREKISLKPVMKWVSRIAFVRTFPPGCPLSYGGCYVTERETTRVAYLPIGYADGYPRALSNCGSMLIAGKRCRILGTVCMDWVFVDVTDLPGVGPGDEVVVMGGAEEGTVTADEMAEQIGTIPYEVLCNVSKRIPRSYVR